MPDSLANSRRYCQQLARRSGRNFYFTFLTLPRALFGDMCVLYAFMRLTDDIADNDQTSLESRKLCLSLWRQRLNEALDSGSSTPQRLELPENVRHDDAGFVDHEAQAVLPAVAELIQRRNIPPGLLHDVVDGVESDLAPRVFHNFGELGWYCYQVAGAVGLCCIHVWGFRDQAATQPAIDCGTAFQLTNILRDLQEDAQANRVYLPLEDLERFGCTTEHLREGRRDERFRKLMAFEVRRARDFYRSGAELHTQLERPGRAILSAMFRIYGGLLDEIERRDYDVISRRVSLSRTRKAALAARSLLWPVMPPIRSTPAPSPRPPAVAPPAAGHVLGVGAGLGEGREDGETERRRDGER
jgi:phytoene synthase